MSRAVATSRCGRPIVVERRGDYEALVIERGDLPPVEVTKTSDGFVSYFANPYPANHVYDRDLTDERRGDMGVLLRDWGLDPAWVTDIGIRDYPAATLPDGGLIGYVYAVVDLTPEESADDPADA